MEGNYLKDFLASETSQKKKEGNIWTTRNICERTYYANKHKSDDAQKKGTQRSHQMSESFKKEIGCLDDFPFSSKNKESVAS